MLDDADATGYIKPRPNADAKRRAARAPSARRLPRSASGGVENSHNGVGHSDHDGHGASEKDGCRGERRGTKQRERGRDESSPEDEGDAMCTAVLSAEAGSEAEVAAEGSALPGREAGGGKRGDGGRSVLLRRVALSACDGDSSAGVDDRNAVKTAGVPHSASTRRGSGLPPQQTRGPVHGSSQHQHPDSLDDGRLPAEPPGDPAESTSSLGKSR